MNEKTVLEKIVSIITILCSVSVIILAIMWFLEIWKNAITAQQLLLGVVLLAQSIGNWKKSRGVAIFSLCGALFIFTLAFIILFVE